MYALADKGKVSDLKSKPFVLKEGCAYRLQVTFKTQHEIVTGLKFVNTVARCCLRLLLPLVCAVARALRFTFDDVAAGA